MRKLGIVALFGAFLLCFASVASSATEVVMSGDFRVHGNYLTHTNFTPWNARGMNYWTGLPQAGIAGVAPATGSEENFMIYQRFRLRTDFIANEALKFRFGIRVNNVPWGNGTNTVDNPAVAIDVNQAYLQFLIPQTDVQLTIGYQPLAFPTNGLSGGNLVLDTQWGNTGAAAFVVDIPVVKDTFAIKLGYTRLLDNYRDFYPNTQPIANELDGFFLTLPITVDGFKITPWAAMFISGRDSNWAMGSPSLLGGTQNWGGWSSSVFANMNSAASLQRTIVAGQRGTWRNSTNTWWWAGAPITITALDPFKIYADVLYGAGAQSDSASSARSGWFLDLGFEYTGLGFMTPQLFGWWSTGENKSLRDGSERLPMIKPFWNFGGSFLFEGAQTDWTRNNIQVDPTGSWGLGLSLKDITFVKDLSHRLTFVIMNGTSDKGWARQIAQNGLNGIAATMGKNLTTEEWLYSINFDHKYYIYQNLYAALELGWAHVDGLRGSVWGSRNVRNYGDAWKVAFGFRYNF